MNKDYQAVLDKVFQPKPAPAFSTLPDACLEVLKVAKDFGITPLPVVIEDRVDPGLSRGRIDFHSYSEPVIILFSKQLTFSGAAADIAPADMASTLAHELGHCDHLAKGKNYENAGYKWCEDHADLWRARILASVAFSLLDR